MANNRIPPKSTFGPSVKSVMFTSYVANGCGNAVIVIQCSANAVLMGGSSALLQMLIALIIHNSQTNKAPCRQEGGTNWKL